MTAPIDDIELATRLVWAAEQMKHSYVTAGLCIARMFCTERSIDPARIEYAVASTDSRRGGSGTLEQAVVAARVELELGDAS